MSDDVVLAVQGFLHDTGLPVGTVVAVGVSGGPDSVALLHALREVSSLFGVNIHVLHVNHGLRGAESEADAEFVRRVGSDLDVPVTIHVVDVPAFAKANRLGIEEAARELRYRAFAESMMSLPSPLLCLGHNANDQMETVLLHLVRGTGLDGLVGMRPLAAFPRVRPKAELHVGRPLLDVSRPAIERFLADRGIAFRVDSSNFDTDFVRNRLRSEIVPALASINPGMMQTVQRMVGLLREDQALIDGWVDANWTHVCLGESRDKVTFDAAQLGSLSRSLQTRLLRRAVSRLRDGDIRDVTATHLAAAIDLLGREATGKRVDWPRGLSVAMSYETIEVRSRWAVPSFDEVDALVKVPGRTEVESLGVRFVATSTHQRCERANDDCWHADLDADSVGRSVFVRRRRPGDSMMPLGMADSKKIQDILVDAKVPRELRDTIPVVHNGDAIVWLAGLRIGEQYKVRPTTQHCLCLRVESLDPASPMWRS